MAASEQPTGQMKPAPGSAASEEREKSRRIGSLRALGPFLAPYKAMLAAAFAALVLTAVVSLTLPLAVRRVVDGFETSSTELLDKYFLALLGVAIVFAGGAALRFYLVTRLGERVVADIRKAVFDRMIGMSPAFYERIMTGEVLSRITTDTTLLLSVISSSVSIALRNLLILLGGIALMFYTSPKLSGSVLLIVPVVIIPIVVLGRRLRALSRESQDWIAESSGTASEALLAVQTVQAFTHERPSAAHFDAVTERSFDSAKKRIATRAVMTIIVISLVFAGIVGVLWIGARDVRAEAMSVGELIQFLIYAIMVGGSVGALSEIWGELQRASGATERLVELLNIEDTVQDPASGLALPQGGRGAIAFENVVFHYPTRPESHALDGVSASPSARARPWRWSARPARASRPSSSFSCGSTIPVRGASARRGAPDGHVARRVPPRHGAGAAGPGDLRRLGAREHPFRPPRRQRRGGGGRRPRRRRP
jgi:ATP-binding cassette subfamily B protein